MDEGKSRRLSIENFFCVFKRLPLKIFTTETKRTDRMRMSQRGLKCYVGASPACDG